MRTHINKYSILIISIAAALLLAACSGDDWTAESTPQSAPAEVRPLVNHEVTVNLGPTKPAAQAPETNGKHHINYEYNTTAQSLQLSWQAEETLGVYIEKADHSLIYAGTIGSTGTEGGREARRFYGKISEKLSGEQYIYLHPAPTGETQGQAAQGTIDFTTQRGALGSTAHLGGLIPLVWREGNRQPENQGYAIHLTLTFNEDPGTITSVSLQTMPNAGNTEIFPASFVASSMAASTPNSTLTLTTSGTATDNGNGTWTAEAYIAGSHVSVDVFRTKFDVKVEAANGTYYNEFRSFPGQEEANVTSLPMLANGKCYNLTTAMSKNTAPTVISNTYHLNSLLGMWNEYGKTIDPFAMVRTTGLPTQLDGLLGDAAKQTAFTERTLINKSSQGSPTFTWDMVTKQITGNTDGYKQANVTYNNIGIVNQPTEVYVTFISEYAWAQNLLGYYHYPTGSVPDKSSDVMKTIIFPNVSKPGHVPYNKGGVDGGANVNPNTDAANVGVAGVAPLQEYTTVQLLYNNPDGTYSTLFPAGTTIGFFIMRDSKASATGSDLDTEHQGQDGSLDHTGYTPRPDNTLLDWNSWRLFTNTAWNSTAGNTGWWSMNCQNFFCSADVGDSNNGGVIPGLALYGAKDDASHNYNYSFSAMIFMVSTSDPSAMETWNKAYFNIGTGNTVIEKQP